MVTTPTSTTLEIPRDALHATAGGPRALDSTAGGYEHWILREQAMSTEFYSERAMNGDEEITNVDCKHNYSLSASPVSSSVASLSTKSALEIP